MGYDPWLAANWDATYASSEEEGTAGPRVFARAVPAVVDSARLWGGIPLAVEALRGLFETAEPVDRLRMANALGQLGDATGLPVLLEALSSAEVDDGTLEALAALGPIAASAARPFWSHAFAPIRSPSGVVRCSSSRSR
jgi:HEAT repeat protein